MLDTIYEDQNFIAINKPAGMLVHSDEKHATRDGEQETVVDWLVSNYPEIKSVGDKPEERPGIVHRLDKDTSGVLIVARNQKFFDYLKSLFQKHEVQKTYLALVWGDLKGRGVINKPIGLKSGSVKRSIRARSMKMVKEAVTEYKALKTFSKNGEIFTLVELHPKTGRTHQLRVHLASIGHPVVGDKLYGKKIDPWNLERHFLHAESIEFTTILGKRIKIEADLPLDLKEIIH